MKKIKVTKIIQFLLANAILISLLGLCGCTLAKEEGLVKEPDKLIGGFVTRAPLKEKIFATAEWIKPVNGSKHPIVEGFQGVEGQFFYMVEDAEDYSVYCFGDVPQKHANIRKDEDGQYIEITATLYYMPRVKEVINEFYLNPIYQTADEQIYAVPGHSVSTGGGMSSEGTKLSLSCSDEQTRTLSDKRIINRVDIDVELEAVYEPLEMYLYQMSEEHEIVKEEKFVPEESFIEYRVEPETDYVHIVTEKLLPNGKTVTIRELIDWEGDKTELYEEIDSEETTERKAEIPVPI